MVELPALLYWLVILPLVGVGAYTIACPIFRLLYDWLLT